MVNVLFLAGMWYTGRHAALPAIAQRGDWMLDGHDGDVATTLRGWLLALADRIDERPRDEHYGTSDDAPALPEIDPPKTSAGWPLDPAIDPNVHAMPDAAQASIATVGAYLVAQFPDPKARVKALHDFVVERLHYDDDALRAIVAGDWKNVPAQDAETVFARRAGVCEGYARLMVALGAASKLEIAYVTGYIRDTARRAAVGDDATVKASLQGYAHAWNAVKLDGQWQLVDATWDDPGRTLYLFTPPRLFAYDHFPDDPKWQLLASPLSMGEFARQPMLSPQIGVLGVTLADPTRAQVTVDGEVTLQLDNPYRAKLVANFHRDKRGDTTPEQPCDVSGTTHVTITCKLDDGEYEVRVYGATESNARDRLDYLGSILANSR